MTTKERLTSKFDYQKNNFSIYDNLDNYIKSFILDLNKHEHIVTFYSCEGNDVGDNSHHSLWAYFGINVSEEYWDYFWINVVPDLISKLDVKLSVNEPEECFFFHACSVESKYEFWEAVFDVFEKHGIFKKKIKIWK